MHICSNINVTMYTTPDPLKHGIYAVRVGIGDRRYDGVASFGRRRAITSSNGNWSGAPG